LAGILGAARLIIQPVVAACSSLIRDVLPNHKPRGNSSSAYSKAALASWAAPIFTGSQILTGSRYKNNCWCLGRVCSR